MKIFKMSSLTSQTKFKPKLSLTDFFPVFLRKSVLIKESRLFTYVEAWSEYCMWKVGKIAMLPNQKVRNRTYTQNLEFFTHNLEGS